MIPKFDTNYNSLMPRHFDSLGVLSDVIEDFDFRIFKKTLDVNKPEHDYMYWYHKDHLGSSTQISDYRERVIHHIEYMPSGEQFSERRDIWATPYKFNGKELDQETGLYYYGARYYTPEIGIWLSVDPLSDNTPNVSPYAYCVNNPVRLVDPDGRDWFQNEVTGSVYFHNKLRKDDAGTGAMKGEGWKHMGENGMFTNGENPSSKNDNLLVANNGGNLSFDKGSNTLNAELMLEGGGAAEGFMSNQGYDKKPKLADVNITESNQSFPEPHSPISIPISSEFIEKVHTWTYEKKESKSNYNTIGNYKRTKNNFDVLTMTSTEKRYERRLYDYSKNSGSMSGSTFNNMLKMGSDFFSTKYNTKKLK